MEIRTLELLARTNCVNGPQTQRPPRPAAQVLGCLAECERTQISHSFTLLMPEAGLMSINA